MTLPPAKQVVFQEKIKYGITACCIFLTVNRLRAQKVIRLKAIGSNEGSSCENRQWHDLYLDDVNTLISCDEELQEI